MASVSKPVPTDNTCPGVAKKGSFRLRNAECERTAALKTSDSECSIETASLSNESTERQVKQTTVRSKRNRRRGSEWEVLEGLKDGQRFDRKPEVFNGYLHKKRKWPLKGWHKRYFVVDGGILVYARGPSDVARGRLHGSLDVGLSVISAKERRRRIDIDADEFIYHLRAKTHDIYCSWLHVLKAHRLYRQHLLTFGARDMAPRINVMSEDDRVAESISPALQSPLSGTVRAPQAGFVSGTPGGRFTSWIVDTSSNLESMSHALGQAQLTIQQLHKLCQQMEVANRHHETEVLFDASSVKKDRRKFGLRKKKSASSKGGSVDLNVSHQIDVSSAHSLMAASTAPPSPGGNLPQTSVSLPIACVASRPQSLPGAETLSASSCGATPYAGLTPDRQSREDFIVLAKDLVTSLKAVLTTLVGEKGRLRAAIDTAEVTNTSNTQSSSVVAALRSNLNAALQQNSDLKSRLSRIHDTSDLGELSSVGNASDAISRQFRQSMSFSSSCVSASEFFDAEENESEANPPTILSADVEGGVIELEGDTSSEAGSLTSEEGSASSDNSDGILLDAEGGLLNQNGLTEQSNHQSTWTRRTRLPVPRPNNGGPSLWNLLRKNIGKDLSQISMPVSINEPLNMLQRLCEELEYSELLDAAAECKSSSERICLISAFAVSAYASTAHRAASKPFNPLLGETYECIREDKGFKFISEQVSHHPPVSVCHAESPRWIFWQEARIKTKFWGKSMEFQPAGKVHVKLLTTGDHYTWNKVTTCVHNLFGGQRWVDQYGDMYITNNNDNITCNLNFIKSSGWFGSRHEVRGATTGVVGNIRLSGRWSEAVYAGDPPAARCLWRPGAMPQHHELYYGFTRFAMELNELEPGMPEVLPHTDTRLRPDQRALEDGDIDLAEKMKMLLESRQRERRNENYQHNPAWFKKVKSDGGDETWIYNGQYWKERENGFPNLTTPTLW